MEGYMDFTSLRYGMFVHYGLYSQMARGEWVMNREKISPAEMNKIGRKFNPVNFNADAICELAVNGGMKYIVLTTMHHDGFRLYDTALCEHNSMAVCRRDLVAETVSAARKHGLKIGLYHSLNNWYDQPDATAALECRKSYEIFIRNTFARLEELVIKFNPIDIMWYDGWWPFNHEGWQAEKMNAMLKKIQPHLIFNGRNGLPGDFGTPEGHISAPKPWRPWEACMTLNDHWGFHQGDHNWKTPLDVVRMLLSCANGRGNLLLNIGPAGDGSIPAPSVEVVREVGKWLKNGGSKATTANTIMKLSPMLRENNDNTDWDGAGVFTSSGKSLFFTMLYRPGEKWTFSGLETQVRRVSNVIAGDLKFIQKNDVVTIELPEKLNNVFAPVLELECEDTPSIYRTGGMRLPQVEHPRYDPCPPDILYS